MPMHVSLALQYIQVTEWRYSIPVLRYNLLCDWPTCLVFTGAIKITNNIHQLNDNKSEMIVGNE